MTAATAKITAAKSIRSTAQAAALLDPLRLRILKIVNEPDSASSVARKLNLPRQKVNYHLRELEKHGLVEFVAERRKRNCTERVVRATAQSYVIDAEALGPMAVDPGQFRNRFSSAYLVAAATRAIHEVAVLRERAAEADKMLPTATLESEIRFASQVKQAEFTHELAEAIATLTAKYHDEHAPHGRWFRFLTAAYPKITRPELSAGGRGGESDERQSDDVEGYQE